MKNLRLYLLLLFIAGGVASCQEPETVTVVVTEVVEVAGEQIVVTRLVEQTVTISITTTPGPGVYVPVELDLGYLGSSPVLDPQLVQAQQDIDLVENLFVGLTNYNHQTDMVEPELAKSWEVSENGRIWTFHLRDDIFWVKPFPETPNPNALWRAEPIRQVVASDVVYAIQRACSPTTNTPEVIVLFLITECEAIHQLNDPQTADLERIGARAIDDVTLEITLQEPASYFLTTTSMWLFNPVPRELVEEFEEEWQTVENIYTSGPFLLTPNSVLDTQIVLHHNEHWPIPFRGNVDIVNIFLLEDEEAIFNLWQDESIDISAVPSEVLEDFLEDSPQKARLINDQTVFYLAYNFDSSVFQEPAIRLAFNAAIDRQRLVAEIYEGNALPMRHLTPPGNVGAPPINETGMEYNPDFARIQMAESSIRSCRLMNPITFLVSSLDLSLRQAELIRDMWIEELGCTKEQIIIEQMQFGNLLANTRRDATGVRPDVWELGWAPFYPDAQNWLGDLLQCNEGENRQNRPCSEVDNLLLQAKVETDITSRISLYRQIENMFFGETGLIPMTPLYVRGEYEAVHSWMEYTPAILGGEQYDTYFIDADVKRLERER